MKGNDAYISVDAELKTAIQGFNSALSHVGHRVGFQTYLALQGSFLIFVFTSLTAKRD